MAQVTGGPPPKTASVGEIVGYIEKSLPGTKGATLAQAYMAYNKMHPRYTPSENYLAFLFSAEGKDLAKTLGIILGDGGKLSYIAAEGTVLGLNQTGKDLTTNPLGVLIGALTNREVLIRIAEGTLGAVLIVVAVAKLISPEQTVLNTVKKAIKK